MTAFDREKLKNVLKEKIIRAYEIRKNNQKDLYRNTLDVFAAVLDAKIQQLDISDWIEKFERPRQAQKTFENLLGEIHPAVIGTLDDWEDLKTGKVIDVLNKNDKIVAEFKNKAITTNSDSALGAYDALEKFVNSLINTKDTLFMFYQKMEMFIMNHFHLQTRKQRKKDL